MDYKDNKRDRIELEIEHLRQLMALAEGEFIGASRMLYLAAVVCEQNGFRASASLMRDAIARLRVLADRLECETPGHYLDRRDHGPPKPPVPRG